MCVDDPIGLTLGLKTARYIASALSKHVGNMETHVKNSWHFVYIIVNLKLKSTDLS